MSSTPSIHPAPLQLAAFAQGRLAPAERAEVERHLDGCAACRHWLAARGTATPATLSQAPAATNADARPLLPPPELDDSIPAELRDHPRYRLVARLGKGGMGDVYLAEHRLMERTVALKVISSSLVAEARAVERFRREMKAAARLAHPNIVTAHDAEQAGTTHFLVMEHVAGQTLTQLVARQGPLPLREACAYIRQAACGLTHAHEKGMVHRDVKPQNLMLTPDGQVKVLDFGLARFASEVEHGPALTRENAVMGTPDYLAPEQSLDAHQADIRADIYSLGCTLYFLVAGRPPFPDGTAMQKIMAHMNAAAPPLNEVRRDVPVELATVVQRMMARAVEQRYQTPGEVVEALTAFVRPIGRAGSEWSEALALAMPVVISVDSFTVPVEPAAAFPERVAPPIIARARRRRWQWAVAVAAVLLVAVGLSGVSLVQLDFVLGTKAEGEQRVATMAGETARASPPATLTLDLGDGVKLVTVLIEKGRFLMGSPESDKDADRNENPQHEVHITKDFYLGRYPVTQEQYQRILARNPSYFSKDGVGNKAVEGMDTSRFPVENVSWTDARAFCKMVSAQTKRRVELPTEAQWEYACRAGTTTRYYWGDEASEKDANFLANVYAVLRTTQVGKYLPNQWGLYDMAGNVFQWCADGQRPYTRNKCIDPVGTDPSRHVLRGGSWDFIYVFCRSAYRSQNPPENTHRGSGFRVLVRLD